MTPNEAVAWAIKQERERISMSLSGLAAKANLSKSTLSQIEAGKGNPNIETLWAIATALELPFSFFFDTPDITTKLIRAGEGAIISSVDPNYTAVILSKCPQMRRRDLYRVKLERGSRHLSDAHLPGTIEHAFVCNGRLRIGPEGNLEEVGPEDYFQYPADVPHSYEALSDVATILLAIEGRA